MDIHAILLLTSELIYDAFGVVFFAFFAVTLIAFRKPLLPYCAASFTVSSALWVMTTIFNTGYMLPYLIRALVRLEHGLRMVASPEQMQRQALGAFFPRSVINLHGTTGDPALLRSVFVPASEFVVPPIVNEDLLRGAIAGHAASAAAGAGAGGGAVGSVHAALGGHGMDLAAAQVAAAGGVDVSHGLMHSLTSSGITSCLAIMALVCLCSALLVAVSVGMVLEANLLENEAERKRQEQFQDDKHLNLYIENIDEDYSHHHHHQRQQQHEQAPLSPKRRAAAMSSPRRRTSCCCQGQGPCGDGSNNLAVKSDVLIAAAWMNKFVGVDSLRYTGVYTVQECEELPPIKGSFLFALPRLCTRLFLGPTRLPSRRMGDEEEAGRRVVAEKQ